MYKYAAFLRGIGPTNPNMRNEKLKAFFEGLGFRNVMPIIGSGNVIFDCSTNNSLELETEIEKNLPEVLGFSSSTFIRSYDDIKELIQLDPFRKFADNKINKLNVTFLKNHIDKDIILPYISDDESFRIIGSFGMSVFAVHNSEKMGTPELMLWLEKKFSKNITTRTWNTIQRIHKKFEAGANKSKIE